MPDRKPIRSRLAIALFIAILLSVSPPASLNAQESEDAPFTGMDESVNETLAEEAGLPARDPLIDTESWGELWNLLLLGAGAVCGFIVGRYWDQIWGRRER
jgi:hypothetical protein